MSVDSGIGGERAALLALWTVDLSVWGDSLFFCLIQFFHPFLGFVLPIITIPMRCGLGEGAYEFFERSVVVGELGRCAFFRLSICAVHPPAISSFPTL